MTLCESARRGFICIDDLCHWAAEQTLCGAFVDDFDDDADDPADDE